MKRRAAHAPAATEIVAVAVPGTDDAAVFDRRFAERTAPVWADRRMGEDLTVDLDQPKLSTAGPQHQREPDLQTGDRSERNCLAAGAGGRRPPGALVEQRLAPN